MDLENTHQWLWANKLTLNTSKTEYMIVGSRQRLGKIRYEETLGVNVDDQLEWNSHINTITTKVSKGIGMT